jgi:hypothetical protein
MQRLSDRCSDSAFTSVVPQQIEHAAPNFAGFTIHLASKKARLPTDLAGPAFGQNRWQMLGLMALPAEISGPARPFSMRVLFLVYGCRPSSICALYFSVRKTYIPTTARSAQWAQKERRPGRKNNN